MAKMNLGNWGALINGGIQGEQLEQKMEDEDLHNQYVKNAMVDPAVRENKAATDNFNQGNAYTDSKMGTHYGTYQNPQQQPGFAFFDPVRNKLADVWQSVKAKISSFLPGQGQHASGPSSQPTVPQASNVAMSPPGPSSSNPASGGVPGATGPMPGGTVPYANGGAIPGRGGALRMRKAKPGNIAKPSKAAQAAMHPPMEKAPVDNQEMGAEGGPPRNTDAQPGSQDPMLANGGFIPPRPKMVKPEMFPKPQPNSVEREIGNDGQRNRLGRTIKKFADGGGPAPSALSDDPVQRAAANRAAKPASVSSSTSSAVNDTTAPSEPAAGLEPADVAPKGVLSRLKGAGRSLGKGALGMYVGAQSLAGADDSLHSSLDEYANRNGLAPGDQNTLGGKAKNLGINTLGALEDVSNRIIPGVARFGAEEVAPRIAGWLSGDSNPSGDPGSWDNRQQPKPAPAAPAPQGPPKDDGMVHFGPDGMPITPYNRAGMLQALTENGGGGGGAPSQGPPKPAAPQSPAPIDFSQVTLDHSEIPTTTAAEWDQMKASIIHMATAKGVPLGQAQMEADNQVSQFQHENFIQYLQQGIALDAAGNKQGAMAALKTAYQYMPTGHDMGFGIDQKTGNIVGYGKDEETGKPVGAPVMLDQQNLAKLASTFADPKNFIQESLEMRKQKLAELEATQGTIPLQRATAYETQERGHYWGGRNDEQLTAATLRASGTGSSRLPVQSQKFYASQYGKSIPDPRDQGEALGLSEQLEEMWGNSPQAQGKIAAVVQQLYSFPMEDRPAVAAKLGIPLPASMDTNNPNFGMPPR